MYTVYCIPIFFMKSKDWYFFYIKQYFSANLLVVVWRLNHLIKRPKSRGRKKIKKNICIGSIEVLYRQ